MGYPELGNIRNIRLVTQLRRQTLSAIGLKAVDLNTHSWEPRGSQDGQMKALLRDGYGFLVPGFMADFFVFLVPKRGL